MSKVIRIGVDARPLLGLRTGIGEYTYQLLRHMIPLGHEWILFSPEKIAIDFHPIEKVKWVIEKNCSSPMKKFWWEQVILPNRCRKENISVFWSPRHHLPILGRKKHLAILTIHDLVYQRYPKTMSALRYWHEKVIMPLSVGRADKIITASQFIAEEIRMAFPKVNKKVEVIYSGSIQNTVEQGMPNAIKKPYVLFLSTLEPRKNIFRLLEAFAHLPMALKTEYSLVLSGKIGVCKKKLHHELKRLDLKESVILLGYVEEKFRVSLLKNATLLAYPSLYEGFGLPIIEAMTLKTPVLTSNIGAMAEIAGEAALLVDPEQISDISEGLRQLLENPDLLSRYSRLGEERACAFSWRNAAQETFDLFTVAQ